MYTDIKDKVGIKEAAEKYRIKIETHGNSPCPFCQGKSSLSVKNNKHFRCFRCDASGSVIDLLILSGICKTAAQAVYLLRQDFHLDFHNPSSTRSKLLRRVFDIYCEAMSSDKEGTVKDYLSSRGWLNIDKVGLCTGNNVLQSAGIDKEELEANDLISYIDDSGKYIEYYDNHIVFPVYDRMGNIKHFSARALDNRKVRWKSTKGDPAITNYFYNAKDLYEPNSKYIVLCEGVSDCLSLKQLNIPTIGQFGINVELGYFAEDFSKFEYIVAVFDRDKYALGDVRGGEYISWTQMMPRLINLMSLTNTPIYYLMAPDIPGIKDINDWLVQIDYDLDEYLEYGIKNSKPLPSLAYKMYKQKIEKHGEIWKSLSVMPDPTTSARLQKLIFDQYGDWRNYMTKLFSNDHNQSR
jgi:hypothetical protein